MAFKTPATGPTGSSSNEASLCRAQRYEEERTAARNGVKFLDSEPSESPKTCRFPQLVCLLSFLVSFASVIDRGC